MLSEIREQEVFLEPTLLDSGSEPTCGSLHNLTHVLTLSFPGGLTTATRS